MKVKWSAGLQKPTMTNMVTALMDFIKADHGYNLDSKSIRNLLQVMAEFEPQSRRNFLQFVSGSPKLPIGGMFVEMLD